MYIIEIKNLCKEYNKNKVLENINFSIEKGKIYGLVGENGAGKTTLLKIICGLTKKTSGIVKIKNTDLRLLLKNIKK